MSVARTLAPSLAMAMRGCLADTLRCGGHQSSFLLKTAGHKVPLPLIGAGNLADKSTAVSSGCSGSLVKAALNVPI